MAGELHVQGRRQFSDPVHARGVAEFFLDELLRNGTTTAWCFARFTRLPPRVLSGG